MADDDLEAKYVALKARVQDLEDRLANQVPNYLPPGVKIPKYDTSGDFFKFLKEFNVLATASNWHPPDCVRFLPLFLEGEAKEIYQNISADKKTNWRTLTSEIAELTKKLDGPMWARKMLKKTKMGINGSVTEFANKIRELVEQASPDPNYTDEARESESVHYFLPTKLKRKLFFMEKPDSLIEAIAQAKKVIQVNEEIEKDEKGDEMKQQIAELTEQVNAISFQSKVNNKRNGHENGREFVNPTWRRDDRNTERGNFRGNRGNNWRSNQNAFRGKGICAKKSKFYSIGTKSDLE